jgi:hypothetical protein
MAEPNDEQGGEESATAAPADVGDEGELNDPLTQSDVKAPRAPFKSDPPSE